jgi:hypothetical protein
MATPEFDIGSINLDLAAEPAQSVPVEMPAAPAVAPAEVSGTR